MIDNQYQLANNPETSPEILRELSQSDDRATRQAVAGNPNVPIEVLWELMHNFPHAVIANMVKRPEIDPQVLWELSGHPDRAIREAVSQNPNTPIEVLWNLLPEFSYEITENPVFSLIILVNPTWILDVPESTLIELFKQSYVPEVVMQAVQNHVNSGIREAALNHIIANHPISTDKIEEIVLQYNVLCQSAIEHPQIHIESLKKFAIRGGTSIQSFLARLCCGARKCPKHLSHQEILSEVLPALVEHGRENVNLANYLLRQAPLPPQCIGPLLNKLRGNQIIDLLHAPLTPMRVLEQLINHPNPEFSQLQ
jgi:hypothetical protein